MSSSHIQLSQLKSMEKAEDQDPISTALSFVDGAPPSHGATPQLVEDGG